VNVAAGPVVRTIVLALPAVLVVVFAGIIALLSLALNKERRDYALQFAERSVELAAVLVGAPTPSRPRRPGPEDAAPRQLPER
jgi:hypothetical protein